MESHISATQAARTFSDLLNRVLYRGEEFVIERGGEPVGRLAPVRPRKFTVADMVQLLRTAPKPDTGYGKDLERIRKAQKPEVPRSRWDS